MPDRRRAWPELLLRSPTALLGLALLGALLLAALLAPLIAPDDPTLIDPPQRLLAPSRDHWFGTDDLGRDVFSRVLYGGRVSLLVGASVTVLCAGLGSLLGVVAGYYRKLDGLLMRLMDGLLAFPSILLAIAVVTSLGANTTSIIIALVLGYTPVVARLMRGATLAIQGLPYVEGARAIGLPDTLLLWRYVLRNALSPLIVQCAFIAAYAILAEASLAFLGASGDPNQPSWGQMLRDGQRLIARAWWIAVPPGVALFLVVLALNLTGDALRDAFDPRSGERRGDGVVR